ncbi:MAG: hypothetical protein GXO75_19815, partial [Calditrichaeota bacterium]|nr:hypothetical protein [Calditrichota bacterium]
SDFSVLTLIGTGVGIGSPPAEKFFAVLEKQFKFDVVASDEFYLKILVKNEETAQAAAAVHDAFFEW